MNSVHTETTIKKCSVNEKKKKIDISYASHKSYFYEK